MKKSFAGAVLMYVWGGTGTAQTLIDLRTQVKSVDFSSASSTKPSKTGTVLPANCSVGEMFFKTDASAGKNQYGCTAANTWTPLGSADLPDITGKAGQVLSNDGTGLNWRPLGGDVAGQPNSVTVNAIRGRNVGSLAPQDGQALIWNAVTNQWEPRTQSVQRFLNYGASFIAQTNITIAGSAHQLGTANLLVDCYNNATPPGRVEPDSIKVDTLTYDVNITFVTPQSGFCVLNGSGGGPSSVANVFGRTGAISAQAGDYSFAQITGSIANSQVGSGIDPVKIGSGRVTSTIFDFLANIRGDVQGQIDGKSSLGHTHIAGGDLSGDVTSAVVAKIQGRPVSAATPQDGQGLVWNTVSGTWEPGAVASTTMASQLTDLTVTRTSTKVLSIGANCSLALPCNVRFADAVYSLTGSATATISAGTMTAFIYVARDGTLTVGHNGSVTCSGCTARSGVTSFPPDGVPLFTWSALNGVWDVDGGSDLRAWMGMNVVAGGPGIATTVAAGQTTVSVDTATVPMYLAGSAVLDFPNIAPGTCAAEKTVNVAGASLGDAVAAAWPGGLESGLLGMMRVSASNTVAVRICNLSATAADPASATYAATIVRSF